MYFCHFDVREDLIDYIYFSFAPNMAYRKKHKKT